MNAENADLVQRCLDGDAVAWTNFVNQHKRIVYSICNSFKISHEDAEDLAQEVFIKVWMNLPRYNARLGGLTTWIGSITHNLRVDRFRGSRLQRSMHSIDDKWDDSSSTRPALQIADRRSTPHDSAFTKEVGAIIGRAANEMSPEMWEAVSLRFVREFDYREMSHRLSVPEGTVKSRVNRGRTQLRFLLRPMRAALGVD